jgi:hypothetical protein
VCAALEHFFGEAKDGANAAAGEDFGALERIAGVSKRPGTLRRLIRTRVGGGPRELDSSSEGLIDPLTGEPREGIDDGAARPSPRAHAE